MRRTEKSIITGNFMMISTSDLQALIEKVEGGSQGVDLVKIGQNYAQQGQLITLKNGQKVLNVCKNFLQCRQEHCVDFVLH